MKKVMLAVVGLPGSGKSEVTKYLIEKTKAPKVHFGEVVTIDEMHRRGLERTQANERIIRESLREELGMAAMAIKSEAKIRAAFEQSSLVILESLYSWEEFLFVREKFGDPMIINVFASPKLRYQRLVEREHRGLASLEEAKERDFAQITFLNQGGPIAIADYTIINNGSLEDVYAQLDIILEELHVKRPA